MVTITIDFSMALAPLGLEMTNMRQKAKVGFPVNIKV